MFRPYPSLLARVLTAGLFVVLLLMVGVILVSFLTIYWESRFQIAFLPLTFWGRMIGVGLAYAVLWAGALGLRRYANNVFLLTID